MAMRPEGNKAGEEGRKATASDLLPSLPIYLPFFLLCISDGRFDLYDGNLRAKDPAGKVIFDQVKPADYHKVIAEVDWDSAFTTVHTDAIYMMESQQYYVDKLDLERKKAYVRKVDVDYYTDAITNSRVTPLDTAACCALSKGSVMTSACWMIASKRLMRSTKTRRL